MFDKTTIRDIDPKNKNILVRTDFNVPIKNGQVTSDFRLRAALPTIQYLIDRQANHIILISHLGRPKGQADSSLSLAPVAQELSLLLNRPVTFIPHLTGSDRGREQSRFCQGNCPFHLRRSLCSGWFCGYSSCTCLYSANSSTSSYCCRVFSWKRSY